jgi:soluble lytic murein transglycosylase-like protein
MRYLTAVIVALLTFAPDSHFNAGYDLSIDASQTKSPELATPISVTLIEPVVSSDADGATEPDVTTNGAPIEAVDDSSEQPAPAQDLCEALKEAADQSELPVSFFARLLWQESRFRTEEISHAGAQGIAQFMPGTAAEVGLDDPFNAMKAIRASAKFLHKLHDQFGNLGLAAAAYNAGSGRIQRWLLRRSTLPRETRAYVKIITGHTAAAWTEESTTVALPTRLPIDAPCEGVAGLSKTEGDPTPVTVHLAPSISAVIREMKKVPAVTEVVDTTEGTAPRASAWDQ